MKSAAGKPIVFRSGHGSFQRVAGIAALGVTGVLLVLAAFPGHTGVSWLGALGGGLVSWGTLAVPLAVYAQQRVEIDPTGQIRVRGSVTGFRSRSFHAADVLSLQPYIWRDIYKGLAGQLNVRLSPDPGRSWDIVTIRNRHAFGTYDLPLIGAIAAAVQAAQPKKKLSPLLCDAIAHAQTKPRP